MQREADGTLCQESSSFGYVGVCGLLFFRGACDREMIVVSMASMAKDHLVGYNLLEDEGVGRIGFHSVHSHYPDSFKLCTDTSPPPKLVLLIASA